jgi:hypothetical protein
VKYEDAYVVTPSLSREGQYDIADPRVIESIRHFRGELWSSIKKTEGAPDNRDLIYVVTKFHFNTQSDYEEPFYGAVFANILQCRTQLTLGSAMSACYGEIKKFADRDDQYMVFVKPGSRSDADKIAARAKRDNAEAPVSLLAVVNKMTEELQNTITPGNESLSDVLKSKMFSAYGYGDECEYELLG